MADSYYVNILTLIRVLVDETTKEAPLTAKQILQRCENAGTHLRWRTARRYIRLMGKSGIVIKHRKASDGFFLYWYDDGWI